MLKQNFTSKQSIPVPVFQLVKMQKLLLASDISLLLLSTIALVMPAFATIEENSYISRVKNGEESRQYAVVFDAGSSGSRVHVFCFYKDMALAPVGDAQDLELFVQTKPGLSAYAQDPPAAASSLGPLLDQAKSVVPKGLRSKTPVRVGATAGLRSLKGNASERILKAVRDLLKNTSTFKYDADAVSILSGSQEGSYMWMTINYLLGNLGKKYANTVGIVDLGGGSVQIAYAISARNAANAPKLPVEKDPYVNKVLLKGAKYFLYVHSYLNYGLLAARAKILKVSKNNSGNPCILAGYEGFYKYGGVQYKASASSSGSSLGRCRRVILKALNVNESCAYGNCTFGGVWNGGGGIGQRNLYIASYFVDKAGEVGIIDPEANVAEARPVDFKVAASRACETKFQDAKSAYPSVQENDLPYICMDLVYQYTLLVDGFGLRRNQVFALVNKIEYRGSLVEAAWPLGSAIEAVSSVA